MAYNAVPTVATGDAWTATYHNTYIRDNFAAGVPDIFTTKGDIAAASAADVAQRVGIGSNGHVLTADSLQTAGVKWAVPPELDVIEDKGNLLSGTGANAVENLTTTYDTKAPILMAESSKDIGISWLLRLSRGLVPYSVVYKGYIYAGSGVNAAQLRTTSIKYGYLIADDGESTGLNWTGNYASRHYNGIGNTINQSTWVRLSCYEESFDAGNSADSNDFFVPVDGFYLVGGLYMAYQYTASSPQNSTVRVAVRNNTTNVYHIIGAHWTQVADAERIFVCGATIVYATAGQVLSVCAYQDIGNLAETSTDYWFAVRLGVVT